MKHLLIVTTMICVLFPCIASAEVDATRVVTEAYEDVLGRKPDDVGLRQYRSNVIERGWTSEDIRKDLRKSNEYMDRVINLAYKDVLGRKPDSAGLENYRKKMSKGWTEKEIRNELRKSDEFKQKNK
jgi:hypothetical protein